MSDTLPEVKITFVPEGVDAVKRAFKTIENATRQHYVQTAKYAIKAASDTQRAYDKLYSNLDRQANNQKDKAIHIQSDLVSKQKALNDKLLAQEKALTQKLLSEYKTRGTGFKDSLGKLGRSSISASSGMRVGGGASRNQMAGAVGTIFGIGGGAGMFGRTVQGASAGFGVGGLAGGAIGGAAALGTAVISKAFETLIDGIKTGVDTFYSAITQIGGGFSVADSIAKVHKNNRTAVEIAASTAFLNPNEQITSKQVRGIAKSARMGTEFSEEEMLKAFAAWQAKTGDTKQFSQHADFLAKVASLYGGGDLAGTTNQLANIKAQFPELQVKQQQELALGFLQQGQRGSVEFKDQSSLAKITAFAGNQTGDLTKNILTQTGWAQVVTPGAGGSVDEGATEARSYNNAILRLASAKKGKYLAEKNAIGLTTDSKGKITNYDETLKRVVMMKPTDVPESIRSEIRANSFVSNIRNKVSGDSPEERSKSFDELEKNFTKTNAGLEQLDKAFDELSKNSVYNLKKIMIELNETMGSSLSGVVDSLIPLLKQFSESVKDNSDLIEQGGETLFQTIMTAVDIFNALLPTMLGFTKAMLSLASFIASISGDKNLGTSLSLLQVQIEDMEAEMAKSPEQKAQDRLDREEKALSPEQRKKNLETYQELKDKPDSELTDQQKHQKRLGELISGKYVDIEGAGKPKSNDPIVANIEAKAIQELAEANAKAVGDAMLKGLEGYKLEPIPRTGPPEPNGG